MAYQAILTASLFLLLAFAVERLGHRAGIPAVVILIATGIVAKPVLGALGMELRGLDDAVAVVGTIGLILIVLEGGFDLELRRERFASISLAALSACLGFAVWTALLCALAVWGLQLDIYPALILAIPFAVISSAVAIPSSSFLPPQGREFVVYESSLSDILGILCFFALLVSDGSGLGFLQTILSSVLASLVLGAICAIGLLYLLRRLDGHIRFIPLLAGLFALYSAGKMMHLSPLILVLMFGLVINNPHLLQRLKPFKNVMDDEAFHTSVREFKTITMELTFAVRGFFFILLGYWTDLNSLIALDAWLAALAMGALIYGSRYAILRLLRVPQSTSLTWLAPRGLITVLLYLSAKEVLDVPAFMDGAVMLLVLASAVLIGLGRLHGQTRG